MKLRKCAIYPDGDDMRLKGSDYALINLDAVSSVSGFNGKYIRVTMMGGEFYNLKGNLDDIKRSLENLEGNVSED